jgi:hypothetical protein
MILQTPLVSSAPLFPSSPLLSLPLTPLSPRSGGFAGRGGERGGSLRSSVLLGASPVAFGSLPYPNKPDLAFFFLLLSLLSMVAGMEVSGQTQGSRSEALRRAITGDYLDPGRCILLPCELATMVVAAVSMEVWCGWPWYLIPLFSSSCFVPSLFMMKRGALPSHLCSGWWLLIPYFSGGAPAFPVLRKSSWRRTRSGEEDGVLDRVRAQSWWLIWSGYGAGCGDWLPADSTSAPYLLAERRPFYYLQAMEPKRRQRCFFTESAAWSLGSLAVPSGAVPGDGEVVPVEKKHRTRLRSSSLFRGPLCNNQGPVSYFPLFSGPDVTCCVPTRCY